jgi:hypothetical protein
MGAFYVFGTGKGLQKQEDCAMVGFQERGICGAKGGAGGAGRSLIGTGEDKKMPSKLP